MKSRNTILALGISTIFILISVQVFIINEVWVEKDVMFDLRYKALAQEAMDQFDKLDNTDGFDFALDGVNKYAADVMTKEINNVRTANDLKILREDILKDVINLLNELQTLDKMLVAYFTKQGYENEFNKRIVINSLQLIDFSTELKVYPTPQAERVSMSSENATDSDQISKASKSRILVKRFIREDNYYKLNFDYYIDFSDKRKMVLREMAASLSLSSLSILVVVIIFLVAYRNLMEERRLSNLKTDFINNMTHELKTPLSTITVAGKTLEMQQIRNDDAKILETAKMIGKQSVHLNQLINLILEISMWERTQFQLDKKHVEIEELMHEIVESFRSGCGTCAEIKQKYLLDKARAEVDVVYFTTMINNLLTNAVKYSKDGPVIDIEGLKDKDKIYIKITDNGIGIDKNHQKHIFDKFYRVTTGNIHKTKGLGLGLYYVKRIAESHGGDVSVSSKPGKGSIFTVTIPY